MYYLINSSLALANFTPDSRTKHITNFSHICTFRDQRPIDKKNLGSAYTQIGNGKKLQAYTISGRQIVNEQSIQC